MYQIGDSAITLTPVAALLGTDPRGTYAPGGARDATLAGTQVYVGYPRATWTFAFLTLAQWEELYDLCGYSGQVYIETRDDQDTWDIYRAIANLPDVGSLDRWGGGYRNVALDLILVEVPT